MKFANMISMLHRTCRFAILMLCIVLLSVQPASATDVTLLFSDDFENDTLGSLPTIAAPDVGIGYSDYDTSGGAVPLIVQDPSASLEARAGQYWDFFNNTVGISSYIADFTSQSMGTITASLDANVIGDGANGGSLGMAFMHEDFMLTLSHPWGLYTGMMWSANAWIHYGMPLPTGISSGDVFLSYYDGAGYKAMKAVGGTEADGAAIGGEGKWHTITLTQDPIVGSWPQFTLDGVLLEPVPIDNEVGAIDGLLLMANGPGYSHGYADVLQIVSTAPQFLPADLNLDTYVDALDAAIMADNWLSTSATLAMGDINGDNVVNDLDATLLAANWGRSANAAVPEPAWLTLVLGAIPILYLFRRR